MLLPFVLWRCFDEVVEGKRNAVYLAEVGMPGFERARHMMGEKIWPLCTDGTRRLRSAIKE